MEAVHVRRARPDDADGIARVHVDSWRTTYRGIVSRAVLERLSESARAAFWRRSLSDPDDPSLSVVAITGGNDVVGFASGGPERDGIEGYSSELYAIYILAAYQRRKLGRRLVRPIAEGLRDAGSSSMLVWVLAENPSRDFYGTLGAREVATKPVTIGPDTFEEVAYGWDDLDALIQRLDPETS